MNSIGRSNPGELDLAWAVPTTPEDVAVLRRLARETASWFALTPAEIEALIPKEALDACPVTSSRARPFTLS